MNKIQKRLVSPNRRRFNLVARGNFNKRPSVVIIDDDENLTENVYKILLEKEGYRVLTGKDGLSGLAVLKGESVSPDLVLVDCSMPEMDGETFLIELKKILPNIFSESKVVGFTSFDPRSSRFLKIKSLAFDCRQKPFDIEGFLRIVSDYIGRPSGCVYA